MIGDILQPTHLLFVLVIALLVLGPKRLPEVGRSLGRGLRDFRQAMSGDDLHESLNPGEQSTPTDTSTTPAETSTAAGPAAEGAAPEPSPSAPEPSPPAPE